MITDACRVVAAQITEAQWQKTVCDMLDIYHWRWYHANRPKWDKRGLPDLIAVRGTRLLFLELKTMTGKIRREQAEWIDTLRATGKAEVYVIRPCDGDYVEELLK